MAGFRQTVLSACWVIPALGTFYFWVVALSTFSAPHSEPSTSPIPAPTKCNPEAMKKTISAWMRWMTTLIIISISILCYVRKIVESLADAESKGNSYEEEAYKLAREDLKQAIKEASDALATLAAQDKPTADVEAVNADVKDVDAYVKAVGMRNMAIAKAESAKPKEGLARLPRGRQERLRLSFFFVVFFSFGAGVCASIAFYLSLSLQIGCADGVIEIAPFIFVGSIFLVVHLQAAYVAFAEY